jgi:hypothetical protein
MSHPTLPVPHGIVASTRAEPRLIPASWQLFGAMWKSKDFPGMRVFGASIV